MIAPDPEPVTVLEVEVISTVAADPGVNTTDRSDPIGEPANDTVVPCDDTAAPYQTAVNDAVHLTSSPTAYSISDSVHL